MIHAKMPDGQVLVFPDGTDQTVIEKTVAERVQTAKSNKDAREANSGIGGFFDSLGRSIAAGATFNTADEIAAGADAALGHYAGRGSQADTTGQRYEENLAAERARDRTFAEDHPYVSAAGNITGGVAGALAGGPVIAGARAAIQAAPRVAQAAPGFLRAAGNYIGTGALSGGAGGFGEGEGGLWNRLISGGTGAAVGGAFSGLLGGAVNAVPAVAGRVGHWLGLRDPQVAADRQIVRAFDRSGVTVDEAGARLAAAGDAPVAMVDVGGRNTVNLGATAANTPGAAMEAADKFSRGRRFKRPDRLENAGDEAFGGGSGSDIADVTAARQAQRTAEASPLYKEAFGRPAGMTDAMGHIIDDPIGQAGLRRGLEIQRIENATRRARGEPEVPTTDPAIHFDDAGVPRIIGVPNMRSLDAIKRGMDAIINDARDATTGRVNWTERLHAIDDMRRTWVGLLDQNNPEYAAARAAWGGPSAQMEATEAGRRAFRTDRDVVAQRMGEAVPPDVQGAYRLGAGRDFANRVSDPKSAPEAARDMLEDRTMQARLLSLLGPEGRDAMNATLRREVEMANVEQAVSPRAGSHTGRLLAGGADMGIDPAGPWVTAFRQVMSNHPWQAAGTILMDQGRRLGQGINPATSDALANRLFSTDPVVNARAIEAIRNRLLVDQEAAARARGIIRPAVRGVAQYVGGAGADLLR